MEAFLTKDVLFYTFLGVIVIENLFELYVCWRQVKVYHNTTSVPRELRGTMTEATFTKARNYGLDWIRFHMVRITLMELCLPCIELCSGTIPGAWQYAVDTVYNWNGNPNNEIAVSCVYTLLATVVGVIKDLPFDIYAIFGIEQKHGFNKQTPGSFVGDVVVSTILNTVFSMPLVACIIHIVQSSGDHFFIWLWVFTTTTSLALFVLYPVVIAPLFDIYKPLEEGPLRASIEELALSVGFPLKNIYIMEGSARSSHSNAYFFGLWNAKRIVLYDTLLMNKGHTDDSKLKEEEKGKGCTNEEVLAVLAHELGHWKHGHIQTNIIILQFHLMLMFGISSYFLKYSPMYEAVGFAPGVQPIYVGLGLIIVCVMAPFNMLMEFGHNILSRHFEYQADEFAHSLGLTKSLKSALIKLHVDNLTFPIYDPLYASWNHSHPNLLERLKRLKELDDGSRKQN